MDIRLKFLVHPLLFSVLPVLALLGHNLGQVKTSAALRPLILAIVLSVGLVAFLYSLVRNGHLAGLIATLLIILFCSYGHVYAFLTQKVTLGFPLGHRYLAPLWLTLFGCGLYLCTRFRDDPQLTHVLNAISLVAMLPSLVQIGWFELRPLLSPAYQSRQENCNLTLGVEPPDIYYLVLDAYSRADVLKEVYHHDNSPFLEALKKKGFYVAHASQSNYAHTAKSLASTLNLNYLSDLGLIQHNPLPPPFDPQARNRRLLADSIARNEVRRELECIGYATPCVRDWVSLERVGGR